MKKLMAVAALFALAGMVATGCSKGSQTSSTTGAAASPAAEASAAGAMASPAGAEASPAAVAAGGGGGGDVAHGKTVYSANCASCHGADGTGGVGPNLHGALKNPAMAKTQTALVAWIKNPKPPMPKLYPGTLNDKDVNDVAAFVLATFK